MREPGPEREIYGLLAEFGDADDLLAAAKRTYAAGFRRFDAFSPFPIEGLAEMLGFRDRRVPLLTLFGALFGAAAGYGMQVWTNLDFPLNIGGRPLVAPPAFMLITFELMVLFAVLFAVIGMLALNRLPRLSHPLFALDSFHLATSDKFFLVVFSNDALFERGETRDFLADFHPLAIAEVPFTEEPE